MKTQIEFTPDQVGEIVRQELQSAYEGLKETQSEPVHEDDRDPELLYCIQRVMEYYSSPDQYEAWQQSLST